MQNLIEKIASYTNAVQALIDKLSAYEEVIKKEVPFELWKQFGLREFGTGQNAEWCISVEGKPIPGNTSNFGKSFYWGGNFNYPTYYVTGKQLIAWCKSNLPSLINKATEYIDTLTKDAGSISLQITVPQ